MDRVYSYEKDKFVDVGQDLKNALKREQEVLNNIHIQSRNKWKYLLTKENYNTLVTIRKPMRNKYAMESNMERFFNLNRVTSLFYSVEQNADKLGYHIHLMFNAYKCTKEHLAFALDLKTNYIEYYEPIKSKSAVSGYVTKNMKADQIHYNFYG
jgi:hypothetical protein